MKKIMLILFSFLIIGCSKDVHISFSMEDITDVSYLDIRLTKDDYNVISSLNNIDFKVLDETNIEGNNLVIKTRNNLYTFLVINNYVIYIDNDKKYFTQNKDLFSILSALYDKYTNDNFYTIEIINSFNDNNPLLIRLDQSNNYIRLISSEVLYNFKIHKIEEGNDIYDDVDLLYTVNNVEINQPILIRKKVIDDIRITFDTPYNHTVSIIYNGEEFIKDFESK